ncbi:phosphoacetylglucosamine mutase-like isoform X2 [Lineus longissimus]
MNSLLKEVVNLSKMKYCRSHEKKVQYGTAGFRRKAEEMDFIMYRMGILAGLRSMLKKAGIGLMITASHNPECDNGVKLIDPLGDMLEMSWEKHATDLVNVSDSNLDSAVQNIMAAVGLKDLDDIAQYPVLIGMDTRRSSPSLSAAAEDGVRALGGVSKHYGLLTTPQLHFLVHYYNTQKAFGTKEDYYKKLGDAFVQLREAGDASNSHYTPDVWADGANGVGGKEMKSFLPYLQGKLNVKLVNCGDNGGVLNHMCGADFVKSQQKPSEVQENDAAVQPCTRCLSVDGDCDRVVYFYVSKESKFYLLDGDKIATLIAGYLMELLRESGLKLYLGLIQTAYANGSSTNYIVNELKVPVSCAKTGVKYLHHEAKSFDIGVYFEANGHGTVLFSGSAMASIEEAANDSELSEDQSIAAKRLKNVVDVINQTVGDAISDMLLVETILHARGWSIEDWNNAYTDLPNRLLKVQVKDRTVISTTDAERQTTSPEGLQDAINKVVQKYKSGRSFVRPSGTEDVVRVYAEADTRTNADLLGYEVACEVYKRAGGVGDKPVEPTS